jgi:hypothetical protein
MAEELRRPGVYGETVTAPTAAAAPPLPKAAPSFNPNDPTDQLAKQMLNEMALEEEPEARAKQIEEVKAKAREYMSLTPAERWLRNIKNSGMQEDEANEILDKVLEQGYWEKEYALYRGRLKIVLRSRDAAANQRVANALDDVRTFDQNVLSQARLRVQLACSLVKFRDRTLPTAAPDQALTDHDRAFTERLAFCDRFIAGPIIEAVYRALIDFDSKTYAALSEGASSGF